jgi:ankyrin repeat protein
MGHADVVQCLLTTDDVDVDARDALGATPLWAAARNGRVRVTQLLLQHRAEKDAGRFYGGFMERIRVIFLFRHKSYGLIWE